MRVKIWALILAMLLLTATVSCSSPGLGRKPADTPFPTKTLRPTFTHTPMQPAQALPIATQAVIAIELTTPVAAEPPTAVPPTDPPPTAVPPTQESPTFTVSNGSVNVRGGPGTNYAVLGQISQGQSFPITGKNAAGDWWQFDYNGKQAWIIDRLVSSRATEVVQVAANIPAAPPTARPRPTATRAPVQPTVPPAPTYRFGAGAAEPRPSSNPLITVWCRVWTPARDNLVAGTIRVTRGGGTVGEQTFTAIDNRADPGLPSEFVYNQNCKVELPLSAGTYSAFLVEGGSQASDKIDFTVEGDTRIFILEWIQK